MNENLNMHALCKASKCSRVEHLNTMLTCPLFSAVVVVNQFRNWLIAWSA